MAARIKCFISLRMFFAMIVLLGHCGFIKSTEQGKLFFNRWLNNGGYGVQFFIVLSGFCVYMGYGSKFKDRLSVEKYFTFVKKRWIKRFMAESFYKFLNKMGVEVVFNHADYRLISSRVLQEFANFHEVNLFLRGMIPLVGFPSTIVCYERHERLAGKSHYPLSKMMALAFDGITSLSIKPIRMITVFGLIVTLLSIIGILWAIIEVIVGTTASEWASLICIICFLVELF